MKVNSRIVDVCQTARIETLEISFKSRGADFIISTSEYPGLDNFAVSLRVGPVGMNIKTDEAMALGKALIDAAEHYEKAKALKTL